MNTIQLDKNFFFGGRATFTVDNGKGTHYTFRISTPKHPYGLFKPYFASLLTGTDNETSYTYLGSVSTDTGDIIMTRASKMNSDSVPVKVLTWILKKVIGENFELPEGYSVQHAGKCGCCGRTLTHPESLKNGIGPECIKKFGLS